MSNWTVEIHDIRQVEAKPIDFTSLLGFEVPQAPPMTVTICHYIATHVDGEQREGEQGVEHANATERELRDAVIALLEWSRQEAHAERFDA
jgi:hypothetical protein